MNLPFSSTSLAITNLQKTESDLLFFCDSGTKRRFAWLCIGTSCFQYLPSADHSSKRSKPLCSETLRCLILVIESLPLCILCVEVTVNTLLRQDIVRVGQKTQSSLRGVQS